MEPTIYKPSIYKGAGIYKAGAESGGGGIDLKNVAILTDAANGVNFESKEIVSYLASSGFHIYNSDYSIYPAPQHKQGFEFVCKINNYSDTGDYAIFAAGAPINMKGLSFQIEHGKMWIGIPGPSNTWIDAAFVDVRNYITANTYHKYNGMYDLDTNRVTFAIDDTMLLDDIVLADKNDFGPTSWFNLFSNSLDFAPREVFGNIKIETIKIINDTNIFT